MPEGVAWTTPGGGPLLWVELPKAVDPARLAERLAAERIHIDPSRASFFGDPHLHGFKLSYAYPTPEQLEGGIPRLAAAIARELERA